VALNNVKLYATRTISSITSLGLFIVMLPIVLGAMLIMVFASIGTLTALRHHLRNGGADTARNYNNESFAKPTEENFERPPIEGSYTVTRD